MTFCVTQVTFFVTTKTPTSPGGSGSARPPRKALGSTAAFHLWQPPLAQPHPRTLPGRIRKRMASAFDRQMFTDARSASFPNSAFGLSPSCPREATRIRCAPLGGSGSARPPRKALGPTVAFPHLATASCSTPSEDPARYDPQANGLGMRPTNVRGRAERIPPQTIFAPTNIPCAFPARPHARGWPLGGSGSARPPRKALARPWHSASGHRLLLNRIACSAFARPQFKALRLSSRLFLRPLAPARSTADDALRGKSTS